MKNANWIQHIYVISVEKIWDDDDNAAGLRPDSIEVAIQGDGETITTMTLEADKEWKGSMLLAGGESEMELTCVEHVPVGYVLDKVETAGTDITLTNRLAGSFTVTFDANGHGAAPAAQTVEEGRIAQEPADPTETGFTFGGWYTDAACATAFDFSTVITGDITLYAKWTEESTEPEEPKPEEPRPEEPKPEEPEPGAPGKTTYSISYDLNGGTLDGKTGTVVLKVEEGTVITLPAPTREGYTFDYWQGSRYEAGASYTVEGDHTFTAQWKANAAAPVKPSAQPEKPVITASPAYNLAGGAKPASISGPAAQPARNPAPRTGDESDIALWALIFGVSALGLGAVLTCRKRTDR